MSAAFKTPSIRRLADHLYETWYAWHHLHRSMTGDLTEIDIRLQVLMDGRWRIHTGDPQFDVDHNGLWADSTMRVKGRMPSMRSLARDLLTQIKGQW